MLSRCRPWQAALLSLAALLAIIGNRTWAAGQPAEALPAEAQPAKLQLVDGDRVVLLGGAFIERLQAGGYLETEILSCLPGCRLTFRNLGWSGDNVHGDARAVFGNRSDGFQRLRDDLLRTKPTVVVIAYGANEAHAGPTGLAEFRRGLGKLVEMVEGTKSRILLLGPHRYETKPPPLPDPAKYNRQLRGYRQVVRELARERDLVYRNLDRLFPRQPAAGYDHLTDNGLHLTPYGYWRVARQLATWLGAERPRWRIRVDVAAETIEGGSGARCSGLSVADGELAFAARDAVLPRPAPPKFSPPGAARFAQRGVLQIQGLSPGRYGLRMDGNKSVAATAQQWAQGVRLFRPAGLQRVERLRRRLVAKNELYFHRYRPQNETYLFLFRKHEQGNNAVEIPQFDALVAGIEREIDELRRPRKHTYQVIKID